MLYGLFMRIDLGYEIIYECPQATPMLLMLRVHPSHANALQKPDFLQSDPAVDVDTYLDGFGNLCSRVTAPQGTFRLFANATIEISNAADVCAPEAPQLPVQQLPAEALVYLLGSRYCETDKLSEQAWALFGHTQLGWARVQAICDYVHRAVRFDYAKARATKSACEALSEGVGVCRDFAHVAVAFCR